MGIRAVFSLKTIVGFPKCLFWIVDKLLKVFFNRLQIIPMDFIEPIVYRKFAFIYRMTKNALKTFSPVNIVLCYVPIINSIVGGTVHMLKTFIASLESLKMVEFFK